VLLHEGLDEAAVDEADGGVVLGVAADVEDFVMLEGVGGGEVGGDGGFADAALAEDDDVFHEGVVYAHARRENDITLAEGAAG